MKPLDEIAGGFAFALLIVGVFFALHLAMTRLPIEFRPIDLALATAKVIVGALLAISLGTAALLLYAELSPTSQAQPYAGVRHGVSTLEPNAIGRTGPRYDVQDNRSVTNLFVGYRRGVWSLEVGGGSLARRTSHNVSATFDIVQDISASHVYLAAMRHWDLGPLDVHATLGVARVMFKNHEYGWNENGPDQVQLNYGADRAALYGGGFSWRLDERTALRFDAYRVDRVIRSHWTRPHSDIIFASLGLARSF